jgi:hypothetical protein
MADCIGIPPHLCEGTDSRRFALTEVKALVRVIKSLSGRPKARGRHG